MNLQNWQLFKDIFTAKVMFLNVSVILSRGWSAASVHAGIPPLGADNPSPGAVHAGRYGQQAGGTHPTGMHTCFF